jgi:hypothetical protein
MTCIKTGCLAYLHQYGEYVYGDAFEVNGVLILRIVWRGRPEQIQSAEFGTRRHVTVCLIAEWWDKDLTKQDFTTTLVSEPYGWINHGYDGALDQSLKAIAERYA